jgi:hypothetical protein
MKTLREELIDFLKWYRAEWSIPEYEKDEYSVDDYLFEKSNNYLTSDDGRTYVKNMKCTGLKAVSYPDTRK